MAGQGGKLKPGSLFYVRYVDDVLFQNREHEEGEGALENGKTGKFVNHLSTKEDSSLSD